MARRRSKRLLNLDDPLNNTNAYFDDTEGSSSLSPYYDAHQQLKELSRESHDDTDEEYVITQNDEDGTAGFRDRRRTSTSPTRRKRSRSQSSLVDRGAEPDNFWNFYRIKDTIVEYKYELGVGLIFLIIAILFATTTVYAYLLSKPPKPNPIKFEAFKSQVNQLFQTPSQRNLLSIMYYLGRRLTHLDTSTEPFFILVSASNEDHLHAFISNFQILLKDTKQMKSIHITPSTKRFELNSEVSSILADNMGVVLHRIDYLRADGPQVLHAMSDSETYPHQNSLLVGTLVLPKPLENQNKCTEEVQNYLENEWDSEKLPLDQLLAVLSRITSLCICI